MFTRDSKFYDLVGKGLASLGYTGNEALQLFVNDMFKEKYDAERTFAEVGFPLNPDLPFRPTYEQIEATVRPYTMAAYVDIDSDGPSKSTDGLSLKSGGLPTFKHEVTLDRKILREKMMLAEAMRGTNSEIDSVIVKLLFKGLDDLLGGNYNTMLYQRHQVVSNLGRLVIDAKNNPYGLPIELDFGVNASHIYKSDWYSVAVDGTVSEDSAVTNGTVSPIKILRGIKRKAEVLDGLGSSHWEISKNTYNALIEMPYFRDLYTIALRPDIEAANRAAFGATIDDATLWNFIQTRIGRVEVIDAVATVERINPTTHKTMFTTLNSFKDGVFVLVPDGEIGDVQCGRPVYMETPGSRVALYDGGRTLIRQVFNDENMIQTIKSEVTGLCVPNKTRWFYYVCVGTGATVTSTASNAGDMSYLVSDYISDAASKAQGSL